MRCEISPCATLRQSAVFRRERSYFRRHAELSRRRRVSSSAGRSEPREVSLAVVMENPVLAGEDCGGASLSGELRWLLARLKAALLFPSWMSSAAFSFCSSAM